MINGQVKHSLSLTWRQLVVLIPILVAINVELSTILELSALIWLSGLFTSLLKFFDRTALKNPLIGFSIGLSVITLFRVLSMTYSIQRLLLITSAGILMVFTLRIAGRSKLQLSENADHIEEDSWSPLSKSLLIVASLCFMGWSTLVIYLLSILVATFLLKNPHGRPRTFVAIFVCGAGTGLTSLIEPRFPGQFWASFDQLFRAGIGNSLISWGFHENVGAVGHHLNYHWLSEAVAGLVAKITPTSAVDSTNKIVPLLGVALAVETFEIFANRYQIQKRFALFATFVALIAFNQFDLYSIGSLWGIGLFMVGIIALLQVWDGAQRDRNSLGRTLTFALLLLPLIMLSQATLGINFLLLTAIVAIVAIAKFGKTRTQFLIFLTWISVVTIGLRISILAGPKDFYQQPSISIMNTLTFKGTDTYFGTNKILIILSSILYLMGMIQMLGGLFLIDWTKRKHKEALVGLIILFISCLILANLFSIAGIDAQQIRFLQPMVVLGGWCSFVFWCDRFFQVLKQIEKRTRNFCIGAMSALVPLLVGIQSKIYNSQWSAARSLWIGFMISATSVAFVYLASLLIGESENVPKRAILLAFVGCLIVGAHGRNFGRSLERTFVIDRNSEVMKYEGSKSIQRCIGFVTRNTEESTIIASNMFRIPLPTRDEKYFLLSAVAGRRTFVDGPLYVQIPRPPWLQERVDVSDKFGEKATDETYRTLRKFDVTFFIVSKSETKQRTWEPYGKIAFEDADCLVLELQPMD